MNRATRRGSTPLSISQRKGHAKIVELLKEKVRKRKANVTNCIICLDNEPDVVLVPCGHQNLCGGCAYQWYEEKMRCPTDRKKIKEILALENEDIL